MLNRITLAVFLFSALPLPAGAAQLVTMHDLNQAITFCQGGGVVWMDMTSGRYVYKGSKYFGKGQNAAYVCEVQAIQAGGKPAMGH